jgi:cytochrome c2
MRYVRHRTRAYLAVAGLVALVAVGVSIDAIDDRNDLRAHAAAVTGGDPARGEAMFIQYGCGGCHGVKHVRKATGMVGPPLDGIAIRAIVAGKLANSPTNMQTWIRDPQKVTPGTAMPDLNVGERDARDITAFLYTRAE